MFSKPKTIKGTLLTLHMGTAVYDYQHWGEYGHVIGFLKPEKHSKSLGNESTRVLIKVASGVEYIRRPKELVIAKKP